jgi:hypothetical protein
MTKIKRKHVLAQLKADLIGKDSHRGVTLTYSWLANQVGHFSLGFIPTLLVFSLLVYLKKEENAPFYSALYISLGWLIFELYNFLGPLLRKKKSASKTFYIPSKDDFKFEPAWGNIAFDTFTDLLFFWIGAWCASYYLQSSTSVLIIILSLIVIVIFPASYWFLTKMYLQYANYPKQYRLSQWDFGISEEGKQIILDFKNSKDKGNQLFICGEAEKGKTSISIGLASEMSIMRNAGFYSTGVKMMNLFIDETEPDSKAVWDWRNSDVIIIDDLTPELGMGTFISPSVFFEYANQSERIKSKNLEFLKSKNLIWVLGTDKENHDHITQWTEKLVQIGVPEKKIKIVQL